MANDKMINGGHWSSRPALCTSGPHLVRFGTIVHERLFKPGMLKGFFGSDPFLRIIYEYALKEFEELPIEGSVGRYCLLKELLASLQGCKM
jgi:hypothetical protein